MKQDLNNKLFAQLTKKQTGQAFSLMDKVLKNMHKELDSEIPEMAKNGTTTFLKLYTHLMPSNSVATVNIKNSNLKIGGVAGVDILNTLADFMKDRVKKIDALESRNEVKVIQSEPEAKRLPANSPVNP